MSRLSGGNGERDRLPADSSYDAAQNSRGNVVTLGAGDGSAGPNIAGAVVYGTSYYDTANSRELILANDSDRIAGNTLHVAAADITASSIRNFEKLNFTLADSFKDGRTMLTLSDEGGFSTVTDSGDQVRMKWENLTADTAGLSAQIGAGIQGRNTITLLQTVVPGRRRSARTIFASAAIRRQPMRMLTVSTRRSCL